MDKSYIYAIFSIMTATLFFLIVPKKDYKRTLIYGIVFGGIGDALTATLATWLHLIQYKNMGFFNIGDVFSSWNPVTWTFIFALFFYLLPARKTFMVLIIIAFAIFTYGVGLIFENFGIFEYIGWYRYVNPFTFIAWYSVAAWAYLRNRQVHAE